MTSVPAPLGHPAPPDRPERPSGVPDTDRIPPWPSWSAPAALLAAFAAALVCALVIGLVAAPFGASLDDAPASVSILSTIAQDVCFVAAALLFANMVAPPRKEQFGLRLPPRIKVALAYVVGGYVAFIAVSAAWLAIIGQTSTKDTIVEDLGAADSTLALLGVTFIVCVCAPLAEEFLFRGYIFGALRSNGFWTAAILTGLMFGLVHVLGSPIAFILPLAVLGAGLCFIREKTRSLYPGMALHCVNNTFALGSNQHWGWQIPVALVASLALIGGLVWLGVRSWPWDESLRANPVPS
ncbi:MAG TPA: type II CAAX endopeptidase family protein [Baekduia sp.]|uniref:CPBP family intramembrane glutamic endopeptidase n=1 Tax=Baekduia sp. TaxID=2600305 RepID=UPI002D79F661|nr:type II CAAX endopeptidase family protein [Baekduia sp.]HET6508743.1 type II CAAX endopeptidase family protein [Baekduia sp.]